MKLPEGWPTEEMIEAAKDARLSIPDGALPGQMCRIIFEAMIASAPTAPSQKDEPVYQYKYENEKEWREVNHATFQKVAHKPCTQAFRDAWIEPQRRILYTHPQSDEIGALISDRDELVKALREMREEADTYFMKEQIEKADRILAKYQETDNDTPSR